MAERYAGQRVAVVGLGVEGRSSVRYFGNQGAAVVAYDQGGADMLAEAAAEARQVGATLRLGSNDFGDLSDFDLIVRSPGVRPDHPSLIGLGQKITSQTQLFLAAWRDRSIGVTGTKGKGTTTTLLAAMLQAAGQQVVVGGNIGTPLLDLIDRMDQSTWAVLELSSFQLMDVTVSPRVAVVLMISPEHLNWHLSVEEYVGAKGRLLEFQRADDQAVLFIDSELAQKLLDVGKGQRYLVSRHPVQRGAVIEGQSVRLEPGGLELVRLGELRLRGAHNLENVGAAAVAAKLLGVDEAVIRQGARAYQLLPHRLELVAERNGIRYYNDSFSTTPEAAAAAIDSFGEPLAVIVGGSDKGVGFGELVSALRRAKRLAGVVVIGDVAEAIGAEIAAQGGLPAPVRTGLTTMPEMVNQAEQFLQKDGQGGVVLLSPGAASFGLFANYKDRGEQFRLAARGKS